MAELFAYWENPQLLSKKIIDIATKESSQFTIGKTAKSMIEEAEKIGTRLVQGLRSTMFLNYNQRNATPTEMVTEEEIQLLKPFISMDSDSQFVLDAKYEAQIRKQYVYTADAIGQQFASLLLSIDAQIKQFNSLLIEHKRTERQLRIEGAWIHRHPLNHDEYHIELNTLCRTHFLKQGEYVNT